MTVETEYQDALDYLYSYVDYSLTRSDRYSPDKFNLGRMHTLLERMGNPHQRYPVLHVAGTKGKGSVCVLCAAALQAAGYRVGLYTSPHLSDFAERIQINRQPISHADFVSLVEGTKAYIDDVPEITTFEIATALAFLQFAQEEVDAAVIEVGLGGRLDATNVVTPVVTIITSISYDHTAFLGESLSEIAVEKAGIIKPGVPLVLAPQGEEPQKVVERIAAERGAPVIKIGRDYLFSPVTRSLGGQSLLVWPADEQPLVDEYIESGGSQEWEPVRLHIPLLGSHQVENAASAYAAMQVARQRGMAISEAAIREGFSLAVWPGRFEVLHRRPPVVVDSAHNRDSALKLRLAMDDYFPGLPVILVFGASEDKNVKGMFAELLNRVRVVIATRSTHPRAMDPRLIVELAHQFGRPARIADDIETALEDALRLAESEAVVLVAGSLFVAAGARDTWSKVSSRILNSPTNYGTVSVG